MGMLDVLPPQRQGEGVVVLQHRPEANPNLAGESGGTATS